jgi:hypothetical protein
MNQTGVYAAGILLHACRNGEEVIVAGGIITCESAVVFK